MIIDSHAHIIEYLSGIGGRGEVRPIGGGKVRFLDGNEQQVMPSWCGDRSFSAEKLIALMDEACIDKAVLLHGLLYGLQNEYIYECAKKFSNRLIASGSMDPCIENAEQILERLIHHFQFRILKFEISTGAGMTGLHSNLKIDGKEFSKIFKEAEKYGVTIVLDIGSRGMKSYQIEEMINAAQTYSSVKFVLCHLLAVNGKEMEQWKKDIKRLSDCKNIWFDFTAVPWNVGETYPFKISADIIFEAKQIIGSDRMMWGSDVPQLLVINEYKKLYDFLLLDQRFSRQELDNFLYKTAMKVYGIK